MLVRVVPSSACIVPECARRVSEISAVCSTRYAWERGTALSGSLPGSVQTSGMPWAATVTASSLRRSFRSRFHVPSLRDKFHLDVPRESSRAHGEEQLERQLRSQVTEAAIHHRELFRINGLTFFACRSRTDGRATSRNAVIGRRPPAVSRDELNTRAPAPIE